MSSDITPQDIQRFQRIWREEVEVGIPSESGHPFRREGGHRSDVKAATHSETKAATVPS